MEIEGLARTAVDCGFRIHRELIELKSVEKPAPVHGKHVHGKQVLTYLRLMKLPLDLLMNFGMATFKEDIHASSTATPTSRLRVFACTAIADYSPAVIMEFFLTRRREGAKWIGGDGNRRLGAHGRGLRLSYPP